jgi:clan AA aspartic protease
VGKVVTKVTVTNHSDQARARAGDIPAEQVRSVTLDEVLVDTGATSVCLPADVIVRLGLPLRRKVQIKTATGTGTARLFQDAAVSVMGRETTFDCIELPEGSDALLGVFPLEALGLEPDLRNQRLRVLPEQSSDTFWTV